MHVLIVKTTSLGDVIHTLPAVQDAYKAIPGIRFDWVVESGFAQVPALHPAVESVFPSNVRKWRKNLFNWKSWGACWREYKALKAQVRAKPYDLIIDAQGLIKSGWITHWGRGNRLGFGKSAIKEKWATLFYDQTIAVDRTKHAINRVRDLFAAALGYRYDEESLDYGLSFGRQAPNSNQKPTALLLHGTTWPTKHYPEQLWRELAQLMDAQGIAVSCTWGSELEHARAKAICADLKYAKVLPRMSITELAAVMNATSVAVAVDTGLAHLSAALGVPTVSVYGPTDPQLTGTRGLDQIHLKSDLPCAPCFKMDCKIADPRNSNNPPCLGGILPARIMSDVLSLLRTAS